MGNETTPVKAAVVGLVAAKATALLGLDVASGNALGMAVWALLSAALTYVLPANLGVMERM